MVTVSKSGDGEKFFRLSAGLSCIDFVVLDVSCLVLFSFWYISHSEDQSKKKAGLQRSITMMHISNRHIKIRQKFTKSSWSLCRVCGCTSIVEALLRAERVMYWTFSMATGKQKFKKEWISKKQSTMCLISSVWEVLRIFVELGKVGKWS